MELCFVVNYCIFYWLWVSHVFILFFILAFCARQCPRHLKIFFKLFFRWKIDGRPTRRSNKRMFRSRRWRRFHTICPWVLLENIRLQKPIHPYFLIKRFLPVDGKYHLFCSISQNTECKPLTFFKDPTPVLTNSLIC